jgi:hypothetical protein
MNRAKRIMTKAAPTSQLLAVMEKMKSLWASGIRVFFAALPQPDPEAPTDGVGTG